MAFTAIEIIALVFVIAILVKTVLVFTYPKRWMAFAEWLAKKRLLITAIYLILAIIVGYYVFSAMNVVNIVAAMTLGALLMAFSLLPHIELIASKHKQHNTCDLLKQYWFVMIVWLTLAGYVLYTIFV